MVASRMMDGPNVGILFGQFQPIRFEYGKNLKNRENLKISK